MAGDGWVVDIIWHAMILVANAVPSVWSTWSIEILLVVSFVMQFALTIFAGFRWRGPSRELRPVIWLFYVGGDYVATTALGHLSVSSSASGGGERQLVAFWAPFFLLHLGGPDSITAYGLEDNQLSARYVLELVLRVLGASYVVYKSISGSWTLVPAAWLMLVVGVAKYMEKTLALHRANLGNVRSSVKNQRGRRRRLIGEGGGRRDPKPAFPGDDSALLMKAHSLFHVCKRAMVDSSVEMEVDDAAESGRTLFEIRKWNDVCKVMEMELSLMYDLLYTKAAVIHTWHGYSVRVLSPLATAAALLLVEFSFGGQDGGGRRRAADVVITRMLLVATFLLETASLVRALGSSWTAFLLYSTRRWSWIHHHVLCTDRWHRFRRAVASLGRLVKAERHRRWSGHIGQLNLLQLSTREQPSRAANHELNSPEILVIIPPNVKELVFKLVLEKLVMLMESIKEAKDKEGVQAADMLRKMAESRTKRGQLALRKSELYDDLRWSLGEELHDGVLIWHIATDIYLFKSDIASSSMVAGEDWVAQRVSAIRMMSNYMMSLLVERPFMLPGLVLRRLYELTCEDLARIWSRYGGRDDDDREGSSSSSSSFWGMTMPRKLFHFQQQGNDHARLEQRQKKLARILHDEGPNFGSDTVKSYLPSGIKLAKKLLRLDESRKSGMLLQVILDVWVEMLFYASYRGSRESHARQLSRGGELTTIVWLMAEHIGLFTINRKAKAAKEENWKRN